MATRRETPEEAAEIISLKESVLKNHNLKQKCKNCSGGSQASKICHDHNIKWIKEKDDGKSIEVRQPAIDMDLTVELLQCKIKRCSKTCSYPHGPLEYHVWNDIRLVTKAVVLPRSKAPRYKPSTASKLCTNMLHKGRCKHGDQCDYPHSQNELKLWNDDYGKDKEMHSSQLKDLKDKLHKTHKLQGVCKDCFEVAGISIKDHICMHNEPETINVYPAVVRPLPTAPIMELCEFRISSCKKGDDCTRAHSEFELIVWKDEQEINRAVREPRKEPVEFRTLQMCKAMEKNGRCDFRANCKFAHSQSEIKEWEQHIQQLKDYLPDLKEEDSKKTLDAISKAIEKKCLRLVLDLLLAQETRLYNGLVPIDTMDRVANAQTAMLFLNILAKCLNIIVFKTPSLKEQFDIDSDEEHQEMDVRKLLDVIRHEHKTTDLIYCYATMLIAICHRIAHQCYLIKGKDDDLVFSPVLTGTEGFVKVLFKYGVDFISVLETTIKSMDDVHEVTICRKNLIQIKESFKTSS